MNELYIGLMSGTSLDAIDAVLIDFSEKKPSLITSHLHNIPSALREKILALCYPGENAIQRMGETDVKLGHLFSESVLNLLEKAKLKAKNIQAIGSHGQTIRHMPNLKNKFTLQIGDPNIIAARTGITTVADFRRRDLALGGQGAPLAPAFHDFLFQDRTGNVGVLNIGGIANITMLPNNRAEPVLGFDTGPGNTLMDAWCLQEQGEIYDKDGKWANSGNYHDVLLKKLLGDPYFKQAAPKSTGREYFNLCWLKKQLPLGIKSEDVQATLLKLTAHSICNALKNISTLWVCGGGANNPTLMQSLKDIFPHSIQSTEEAGLHPDWVEAAAFAWLAQQTILGKPGNIPSVTGASASGILGAIYSA